METARSSTIGGSLLPQIPEGVNASTYYQHLVATNDAYKPVSGRDLEKSGFLESYVGVRYFVQTFLAPN
jgi:hypothetical protein